LGRVQLPAGGQELQGELQLVVLRHQTLKDAPAQQVLLQDQLQNLHRVSGRGPVVQELELALKEQQEQG